MRRFGKKPTKSGHCIRLVPSILDTLFVQIRKNLSNMRGRRFENTLKEYRFVEFHYLDQEDLVNKILERKYRRVNGQLTFCGQTVL